MGLRIVAGLLLWFTLHRHISATDEDTVVSQDYCVSETFEPRCSKNEVILIKSATYGRMRIGRCVTAEEFETFGPHFGRDPRYLGCSADVRGILDRKCSGKVECEIRVIQISDEGVRPCFTGLSVYLEASYECVLIADERHSCVVDATPNPIHLTRSAKCGTPTQPWIVEAPVGQKIKLSLIDITNPLSGQKGGQQHQQQQQQRPCQGHGLIVDKAGKRNESICVGGMDREKETFLSAGNTVDVYLNQTNDQESNSGSKQFMIKVEAVGCSDIVPPEDAYLKRKDGLIVITCYSSRNSWHLNCVDGRWIGVFGNCSQGTSMIDSFSEPVLKAASLSNEQVLVVMALCGFTLALCLGIVCFGAVCVRRISTKRTAKQEYKTLNYQFNSTSRHQSTNPHHLNSGLESSVTAGRDVNCTGMPLQVPTYSVYVGESGIGAQDNPSQIDSNDPSVRL